MESSIYVHVPIYVCVFVCLCVCVCVCVCIGKDWRQKEKSVYYTPETNKKL